MFSEPDSSIRLPDVTWFIAPENTIPLFLGPVAAHFPPLKLHYTWWSQACYQERNDVCTEDRWDILLDPDDLWIKKSDFGRVNSEGGGEVMKYLTKGFLLWRVEKFWPPLSTLLSIAFPKTQSQPWSRLHTLAATFCGGGGGGWGCGGLWGGVNQFSWAKERCQNDKNACNFLDPICMGLTCHRALNSDPVNNQQVSGAIVN